MMTSYGETSGFTEVSAEDLTLINGGKGGGGGGGVSASAGPMLGPNGEPGFGITISFDPKR